jgi:hypothetical protein
MLKGEISNRPAAICAVDYKILLDEKREYAWFVKKIPELLLHKSFETLMKRALPIKSGARAWIENAVEEHRVVALSVGVPLLARAIDMILGDYVVETFHFDDPPEFRLWLRQTPQVYKVFTNDTRLLGIDSVTTPHSGWSEKI